MKTSLLTLLALCLCAATACGEATDGTTPAGGGASDGGVTSDGGGKADDVGEHADCPDAHDSTDSSDAGDTDGGSTDGGDTGDSTDGGATDGGSTDGEHGDTDGDDAPTTPTCTTDADCGDGMRCDAGACLFECTGDYVVYVPGDYDTLQRAAEATAESGGTICLADGSHGGATVPVVGADLTIIGAAADRVDTGPLFLEGSTRASRITIKGLSIRGLDGDEPMPAIDIDSRGTAQRFELALDRVDLAAPGTAIEAAPKRNSGFVHVWLTNSYIHDSAIGLHVVRNAWQTSWGTQKTRLVLRVVNNTFARNGSAIHVASEVPRGLSDGDMRLTYGNNLFVDNDEAVRIDEEDQFWEFGGRVSWHTNAYAGNGANYLGHAIAGRDRIVGELELSSDAPAMPAADSPLVDAGRSEWIDAHLLTPVSAGRYYRAVNGEDFYYLSDGSIDQGGSDHAYESLEKSASPAHDFYGLRRDSAPDIGALEYQP